MTTNASERRWAVRGIRGATTVAANTPDDIINGTAEMVAEIMRQNSLDPADIVSIIFSASADLNAAYPAAGARKLGLTSVPLFCATEIDVPGSVARCIRCLFHVNTTMTQQEVRHVYLHGARSLRPDLV